MKVILNSIQPISPLSTDWVLRVEKEGKKEGSIQTAPEQGVK